MELPSRNQVFAAFVVIVVAVGGGVALRVLPNLFTSAPEEAPLVQQLAPEEKKKQEFLETIVKSETSMSAEEKAEFLAEIERINAERKANNQ